MGRGVAVGTVVTVGKGVLLGTAVAVSVGGGVGDGVSDGGWLVGEAIGSGAAVFVRMADGTAVVVAANSG
jgi:hypothetical protein